MWKIYMCIDFLQQRVLVVTTTARSTLTSNVQFDQTEPCPILLSFSSLAGDRVTRS